MHQLESFLGLAQTSHLCFSCLGTKAQLQHFFWLWIQQLACCSVYFSAHDVMDDLRVCLMVGQYEEHRMSSDQGSQPLSTFNFHPQNRPVSPSLAHSWPNTRVCGCQPQVHRSQPTNSSRFGHRPKRHAVSFQLFDSSGHSFEPALSYKAPAICTIYEGLM